MKIQYYCMVSVACLLVLGCNKATVEEKDEISETDQALEEVSEMVGMDLSGFQFQLDTGETITAEEFVRLIDQGRVFDVKEEKTLIVVDSETK